MEALDRGGDLEVALQGLQDLEGSEDRARAVLSAMSNHPATPNEVSSCSDSVVVLSRKISIV